MTGDRSTLKSTFKLLQSRPWTRPQGRIPSVKRDLLHLDRSQDLVVWFGHSSYLLQVGGVRFLIDPVFSGHSSPFPFGFSAFPGSDRYTAADLPFIDVLLISHDHWDHLDWRTVKELRSKVGRVICGLGVGAHFDRWGYDFPKITELDWGDSVTLAPGFRLHATPAWHFSGRSLKPNRSLWCSYVLSAPGRKIFLGGDGGYGKHFADIGRQFGPFDLAILEQGQYDSGWRYIHTLPDQLPLEVRDLQARRVMPVHNSKFCLSNHPWKEPLEHLEVSAVRSHFSLLTPELGEIAKLDDSVPPPPWWRNVK